VDDALDRQIEALRNLKTSELRTRYGDLFGEASPSFNRAHLFRRIAWRLQAEAEGELSERARRRAADLANGFEYHGEPYASLSAIAHRVTGTRWNGFHFFGLKQEWKHE
jgi:Protein of unknown function (DUF2924)